MNSFTYAVQAVHPLTDTVVQVMIAPPPGTEKFSYVAGQYLEIILPSGQCLPFSIANAPLGSDQIELHIRHSAEQAESTALLSHIRQTGFITFRGPFGHMIYQTHHPEPIILLAGGTGFAPLKAIIENALADNDQRQLHLFWGARNKADLYLDELPKQWAEHIDRFNYDTVLSSAATRTKTIYHKVTDTYPDLSRHQVYAAGPFELVHLALAWFDKHGLPKARRYADALAFGG